MKKIIVFALMAGFAVSAMGQALFLGGLAGNGLTMGGQNLRFPYWNSVQEQVDTDPRGDPVFDTVAGDGTPTDIGILTDLTITALTCGAYFEGTAETFTMYFKLYDEGNNQILDESWSTTGWVVDGPFATWTGADFYKLPSYSGVPVDLLAPNGLVLNSDAQYTLEIWAKMTGAGGDIEYHNYDFNNDNNFTATFTYGGGEAPAAVPEPATMSLLGLGALAVALRRKLRK